MRQDADDDLDGPSISPALLALWPPDIAASAVFHAIRRYDTAHTMYWIFRDNNRDPFVADLPDTGTTYDLRLCHYDVGMTDRLPQPILTFR
jgi:hypothetical protein